VADDRMSRHGHDPDGATCPKPVVPSLERQAESLFFAPDIRRGKGL
jgi:hypothetical protein